MPFRGNRVFWIDARRPIDLGLGVGETRMGAYVYTWFTTAPNTDCIS